MEQEKAMMKKDAQRRNGTFPAVLILAVVLVVGVLAVLWILHRKGQPSYTEKEVILYAESEEETGTIRLRFYETMPHVPYIGVAQYKEIVYHEMISVEKQRGCYVLTAEDGSTLVADPKAGTLTSDRFADFRNDEAGILGDELVGFKDYVTPFIKIESIEYEAADHPVVFDLAAYEIPVYADKEDVYLPLSLTAQLLMDTTANRLEYNGENVCLLHGFIPEEDVDPHYYDILLEKRPREEDMVAYSYHVLCFVMDRLYGCPGKSTADAMLSEKGFDRMLTETDEFTVKIKEMLLSEDPEQFYLGQFALSRLFYDGHTLLVDNSLLYLQRDAEWYNEGVQTIEDELINKSYYEGVRRKIETVIDTEPKDTREAAFGDTDTYHEEGDTAVIALDNFMAYDEDAWIAYYEGRGGIPDGGIDVDCVGSFLNDLRRAEANPEIRHVILDLSCNGGGSADLTMFIMATITGKAEICCYDRVTGQRFKICYSVDSLLDGSFDTDAAFEAMPFDFALLTTQDAFSCANLVALLADEAGIPAFGEPSGGGSCMVVLYTFPEGEVCYLSFGHCILVDRNGDPIESGIPVDVDLVRISEDGEKDYSGLYDIAHLSELMNERAE